MLRYDLPTNGPEMATPQGYIAKLGEDRFEHVFGGRSWEVSDANNDLIKPALLMSLDLRDPKLSFLQVDGLQSLPICSHINCDAWTTRQTYQINPDNRRITLVSSSFSLEVDESDLFPVPLPERRLTLEEMQPEDYPINEEMYGLACDRFLGSSAFIRVLGPPLWLQWVEEATCDCGRSMEYLCSFGHEDIDHPSGIIPNMPFFIGEAALYFFLCPQCLTVSVTWQSS